VPPLNRLRTSMRGRDRRADERLHEEGIRTIRRAGSHGDDGDEAYGVRNVHVALNPRVCLHGNPL
jgi:hypothetical protein